MKISQARQDGRLSYSGNAFNFKINLNQIKK